MSATSPAPDRTSPQGGSGSDAPPFADFSAREIENRHERARALMAAHGLDALLATSESNFRWLGGHSSQAWVIKSRPLMAVLPRVGDAFLVVPGSERNGARLTSHIRDVRTFGSLVEPGLAELVDALASRGLGRGVIGCEFGAGHRFGLAIADYQRLAALLPDVRFVDAGEILWELRTVKSPAEVEILRRSATLTGEAVDATLGSTRLGWTERQIYACLAKNLADRGADRPGYMPVNADTFAPDSTTGGPTDRPTRPGRMVYMGAGCILRGYWSDAVRCFVTGRASDEQRATYRVIRKASQRCIERLRPGTPVEDVVRAAFSVFEEAGLTGSFNRAGRIGHGTGLDLSEPPSVMLGASGVLRPGMVLYIEPNCQTGGGNFMVEETYLVTDDGCERLGGAASEELPEID